MLCGHVRRLPHSGEPNGLFNHGFRAIQHTFMLYNKLNCSNSWIGGFAQKSRGKTKPLLFVKGKYLKNAVLHPFILISLALKVILNAQCHRVKKTAFWQAASLSIISGSKCLDSNIGHPCSFSAPVVRAPRQQHIRDLWGFSHRRRGRLSQIWAWHTQIYFRLMPE